MATGFDDKRDLRSRLVLRSRLGSMTGEIAIEDNDLVRGRSVFRKGDTIGDDDLGRGWSSDAVGDDDLGRGRSVLGCGAVGDDDLSRALLGSSSLSLSLSLRAGASPSHSALSVFFGKWEFEGKIETEINLHPFKGQLKSISRKCIFRAQPNTRKYGKAFLEMLFTQNKHSLSGNAEFIT